MKSVGLCEVSNVYTNMYMNVTAPPQPTSPHPQHRTCDVACKRVRHCKRHGGDVKSVMYEHVHEHCCPQPTPLHPTPNTVPYRTCDVTLPNFISTYWWRLLSANHTDDQATGFLKIVSTCTSQLLGLSGGQGFFIDNLARHGPKPVVDGVTPLIGESRIQYYERIRKMLF